MASCRPESSGTAYSFFEILRPVDQPLNFQLKSSRVYSRQLQGSLVCKFAQVSTAQRGLLAPLPFRISKTSTRIMCEGIYTLEVFVGKIVEEDKDYTTIICVNDSSAGIDHKF